MRSIYLFVEDLGHEKFLTALLLRIAAQFNIPVGFVPRNVRGGHGKVVAELKEFMRDLRKSRTLCPDAIIVATDANCKGLNERRKELAKEVPPEFAGTVMYAVPDPHIERWMLLDSAAFKTVFGKGCAAPDQKCEKDRYKRLLLDQIFEAAGSRPALGGMEFASDIVNAMDIQNAVRQDASLDKFIGELTGKFQAWQH